MSLGLMLMVVTALGSAEAMAADAVLRTRTLDADLLIDPLAAPGRATSVDDAPGLFTRVRSTERFMIALIREGYERSPTFRNLVDTLQQSNVIVYVQPAACAGGRIRSCLVAVGGSSQSRQIRIKVDPRHTTNDRLIATVAHELQHAAEVAEHPEVIDGSGLLKLYRKLAFGRCHEGLSEECETTRALATEEKVQEELSNSSTSALNKWLVPCRLAGNRSAVRCALQPSAVADDCGHLR
jgi:hypothetical protein